MAGRAAYLRALAISPASLDNYELLVGVAISHVLNGEFEESINWSLRSLAANPDWLGTYWMLGAAYGQLGRLAEGREVVDRLLARAPAMRLEHLRHIADRHYPRFDLVLEGLRKAGLPD
jgi:tetratricopeptide (TPR) repeat protein